MNAGLAGLLVLGVIGAGAAWLDIAARRLPNWLCLVAFGCGLAFVAATTGYAALPWHLLHAGLALVAGMGLFAIRAVGGGDAKFYAGVAAWFSLADAPRLLVGVSLAGLVVFAVWAIVRRVRGHKIFAKDADSSNQLPFGVAIAAGAVLTLGSMTL